MLQPSINTFYKDNRFKRLIYIIGNYTFHELSPSPDDSLKRNFARVGFMYRIIGGESNLDYIMTLEEFNQENKKLNLKRYEEVKPTYDMFSSKKTEEVPDTIKFNYDLKF